MLRKVNEILGDHNVDKQITDSRGDIAYLMADISNVQFGELKELWESLEALSCKCSTLFPKSFPILCALLNTMLT